MALLWVLMSLCVAVALTSGHEEKDALKKSAGDSLDDDPHCTHHIHEFYRNMGCRPEMTPNLKCPTSYDCPSLKDRKPDMCYFKSKSYPIGFNLTNSMLESKELCPQNCQCLIAHPQPPLSSHLEGARFVCTGEPKRKCPTSPGCRHFRFLVDVPCCQMGVTSCPKGKQDSVKCEYQGRSYSEGERFFPANDITCVQCICAEGFNGTIAPPFCHWFSENLELFGENAQKLTKGCLPVYIGINSCFPMAYRCPDPSDQVLKAEKKTSLSKKTEKTCRFGNLTMEVGDKLSPWVKGGSGSKKPEVECTCRVPPMASCLSLNFNITEELRRDFAREGLDDAF